MKKNVHAKPGQPPSRAKPELMPIQQLICDEVADMLIHGGHERDIESLIFAALGHLHFRKQLNLYDNTDQQHSPKCREKAETRAARDAANWKAELQAAWVQNLRCIPRPEPTDAVGCIREHVIDELRSYFESFLVNGLPEDHRLLRDVLGFLEGNIFRADAARCVPLAEEFSFQLGESRGYLQVPKHIRENVETYVESLLAQSTNAGM